MPPHAALPAAWLIALAGVPTWAAAQAEPAVPLAELDRIGRTIVAARCARPLEVKTVFVRNPQREDLADEMQSIACHGLRIALYRSTSTVPARDLPMSLVLEATDPRMPQSLSIGARAQEVVARLGPPATQPGGQLAYAFDAAGRNTLSFELRDGLVRAVAWTWDVD